MNGDMDVDGLHPAKSDSNSRIAVARSAASAGQHSWTAITSRQDSSRRLSQQIWHSTTNDGRCRRMRFEYDGRYADFVLSPDKHGISVEYNDEKGAQSLLEGSMLGSYVRLLGETAIHANVLVRGGQAIALTGESGAGKSSLTWALMEQGYSLLADDQLLFTLDGSSATAHPGRKRIRLWPDSKQRFGISPSLCTPVIDAMDGMDKLFVLDPNKVTAQPSPLAAIYVVRPRVSSATEPVLETITGPPKTGILMKNRYGLIEPIGDARKKEWTRIAKLAQMVPLFAITMPDDLNNIAQHTASLVRHLAA